MRCYQYSCRICATEGFRELGIHGSSAWAFSRKQRHDSVKHSFVEPSTNILAYPCPIPASATPRTKRTAKTITDSDSLWRKRTRLTMYIQAREVSNRQARGWTGNTGLFLALSFCVALLQCQSERGERGETQHIHINKKNHHHLPSLP